MSSTSWDSEAVLRQFGQWLSQVAMETDPPPADQQHDEPQVGLLQVVAALTAMRHELKLQTKSSRGLEESVQHALAGLDSATRQFQSVRSREEEAAHLAALPLIETLAAMDDSLDRAKLALKAAHDRSTEEIPRQVREAIATEFAQMSWWPRWLLGSRAARIEQRATAAAAQAGAAQFGQLLEGYDLIQRRLRKQLTDLDIHRIETVGRTVDPQAMTVLALAEPQDGPPETVTEEFRAGYRWGDRVIRFAEVRAVPAQSKRTASPDPKTDSDA
jgi:molecular chaperone GrpE